MGGCKRQVVDVIVGGLVHLKVRARVFCLRAVGSAHSRAVRSSHWQQQANTEGIGRFGVARPSRGNQVSQLFGLESAAPDFQ